MALFHADLKRLQIQLTGGTLIDHRVAHVAVILAVVQRKVLGAGGCSGRLDAVGKCGSHFAGQNGIFGIVLKIPPAARIALQIHRRRQQHIHVVVHALLADGAAHASRIFRVPAVGNGHAGGEGRGRIGGAKADGSFRLDLPLLADTDRAVGQIYGRNVQSGDRIGHPALITLQKCRLFFNCQLR